jgi:hypothetical protein
MRRIVAPPLNLTLSPQARERGEGTVRPVSERLRAAEQDRPAREPLLSRRGARVCAGLFLFFSRRRHEASLLDRCEGALR